MSVADVDMDVDADNHNDVDNRVPSSHSSSMKIDRTEMKRAAKEFIQDHVRNGRDFSNLDEANAFSSSVFEQHLKRDGDGIEKALKDAGMSLSKPEAMEQMRRSFEELQRTNDRAALTALTKGTAKATYRAPMVSLSPPTQQVSQNV